MDLSGKNLVVTGAFGVLGAAVVARARSAGARIACIDVAPASQAPIVCEGCVLLGEIDLGAAPATHEALAQAAARLGTLEGLVNVAGPSNRAAMPSADFERWVRPEQVADLIVFLLSEHATAFTGAAIPIAGRV